MGSIPGCIRQKNRKKAQRVTIVHLSTSIWNGTHTDKDMPKNKNLVEDVEYRVLASFQVSLNSIQRLKRRKMSKMSQTIRCQGGYRFLLSRIHNLIRGR